MIIFKPLKSLETITYSNYIEFKSNNLSFYRGTKFDPPNGSEDTLPGRAMINLCEKRLQKMHLSIVFSKVFALLGVSYASDKKREFFSSI